MEMGAIQGSSEKPPFRRPNQLIAMLHQGSIDRGSIFSEVT
jgi:hypothetical protein